MAAPQFPVSPKSGKYKNIFCIGRLICRIQAIPIPMNYQSMSTEQLVWECAHQAHPDAWMEFIARFQPLIASTVIKSCRERSQRSLEVVEDLIQETYVKLCADKCALLAEFEPEHPNAFLGFLQKVAANVVYDHFRKQRAIKRDIDSTVELNEAVNQLQPGTSHLAPSELIVFLKEVDDLLRGRGDGPGEEKERSIFWLYFRVGLTAKAIASIPAMELSVEGVESVIHRLKTFIRKSLLLESAK